VNVRIDRAGKIRLSKPCKGCSALIQYCGLREIWYTDDTGFVQCNYN
jgi:hypothetical protein